MHGALLLARLDRGGMAHFDVSELGFWRSFTAAVLVYPIFLVLVFSQLDDETWQNASMLRVLLVETIGYVIGWTAFPLIMLPFSRVAGRERRWLDLMVAFNWSQVPQAVLVIIAIGLTSGGLVSRPSASAVQITAYLVTLLYEGYVAAVALDVAAALAARERRAGGPTAPPEGLYLVEVLY